MPATITIELKGSRFFANHGWHEEELILGNEFEVTLCATFPANAAIATLTDTIDYTKVYAIVKSIFSQNEKLLETVAQKIAKAIKADFTEIEQLQVSITKLNPVIVSFIGTVGITYHQDFR